MGLEDTDADSEEMYDVDITKIQPEEWLQTTFQNLKG